MPDHETRFFINGKLTSPSSEKSYEIFLTSSELIAKIPIAIEADVDAAVDAAAAAQPKWAALSASTRAQIIRRFSELVADNASILAKLDSICMGKPLGTFEADIDDACNIMTYYSGLVEAVSGQSSLASPNHLNLLVRQPYGVVAAIVPWNFPAMLWCFEVAPACGAGNAILIKTSEKSPLSGILLGQLASQAGFPPGIVNVLSGPGSTGELLSSHMKIRKISFTGSARAGRAVMQAAARSNLKDVQLEMGGKSPLIVFDDANIEKAVAASVASIMKNSGQICTASSRVYVKRNIAQAFKQALVSKIAELRQGDPSDLAIEIGPQADAAQAAIVQRYLSVGKKEGQVLIGGNKSDVGPNYIEPTVFTSISDKSILNTEEIFGPLMVLHEFETESEVVKRANDTEYGLYASVFTSNISVALRVARALEAGSVAVNCTSPYGSYNLPFGGYKGSGIGRQKGSNAVMSWMEEKTIYIRQEEAPMDG